MANSISKGHFMDVARMIAATRREVDSISDPKARLAAEHMRLTIVVHLASLYSHANSQFDRTRFLLACGADANVTWPIKISKGRDAAAVAGAVPQTTKGAKHDDDPHPYIDC